MVTNKMPKMPENFIVNYVTFIAVKKVIMMPIV